MNEKTVSTLINVIAAITLLIGAFGMIFCFPFLWSSNSADLAGAGFPFVGGAILFGAGLITLGVYNRPSS